MVEKHSGAIEYVNKKPYRIRRVKEIKNRWISGYQIELDGMDFIFFVSFIFAQIIWMIHHHKIGHEISLKQNSIFIFHSHIR